MPDLRGRIRALYKRYSNTMVQDAEYEEINEKVNENINDEVKLEEDE